MTELSALGTRPNFIDRSRYGHRRLSDLRSFVVRVKAWDSNAHDVDNPNIWGVLTTSRILGHDAIILLTTIYCYPE